MSSYDERESPEKGTIVEEVEEESVGDGQPQPPTELFKGQDLPRSGSLQVYLVCACVCVCVCLQYSPY